MRETDFSGAGPLPSPHETDIAHGMMRRPERPRARQPMGTAQETRDAMDGRHLKRLIVRQRGQEAWNAPGEHRLSRSGWPNHQEIVRSSRGDLDGSTRGELTANVRHVVER